MKENEDPGECALKTRTNKTPDTDLKERKAGEFLDKTFKITFLKMITGVRRTMHEQSENFDKEKDSVRKKKDKIKEKGSNVTVSNKNN